MHKFLSISIGVLSGVVLAVLVISIFGQYQLLTLPEIQTSQRYALLPGIAVSAGVLIAVLTFIRERTKAEEERRRHTSEVLLAQASAGFKTVVALLSDQNNSRVTWIRAARTLLQAIRLGRQIESEAYKVAYRLEEERTRNELYEVLTLPDPNTKERQALPPQFFYGIDDWPSCPTLDEAAIRASQKVEAHSMSIDSISPTPSLRPLSPRSVEAIFNFIAYPKDYDDPLEDVVSWDENWEESLFDIDQGARRYVAHTHKKGAYNKKLFDRTPSEGGSK